MSRKFHVTDNGDVKECRDRNGLCPYLKADENRHFETEQAAYDSIAEKFENSSENFVNRNADGSVEKRIPHKMKLTPAAQKVVDTLYADGMTPMIVGGSVRDSLLGKESKDVDIEVFGAESADQVSRSLRKLSKVDHTGKSFGVLKVRIGKEDFDVSLPRRDSKTGDGHRGFEIEVDPKLTFAEAAQRRDFTINSLMYDSRRGEIVDSVDGVKDIENKVLRHTSEAFDEDPLRVLRGVQMSGRFDFNIHPDTIEKSQKLKEHFGTLAKERVQEEFNKLAKKAVRPSQSFRKLRETGWDEKMGCMKDVHSQEVYDSVDRAANSSSVDERPALMYGVLGKRLLEKGHDRNSVRETLSYLTVGDAAKNKALSYAELEQPEESNFGYRKWAYESKKVTPREWIEFQNVLGKNTDKQRERFEKLGLMDGPEKDRVNGNDLMAAHPDRKPGPWMKEELDRLREEQYKRD